ncbi:2-hydroxychromene-2-carboxylate isomerase [Cupriavidus sp. AU9028]|uniref:2-hydroxychromene-2-carboxylate isomerase n=1 Tax=Cupriavidus sp. AU9028 TaxID=2871157 RepID=UPI001C94AA7B|nr:2-hydroxychromene-2-carboxylate isomerase [Cupriavidus sp. AU9028]MBY4897367.1 2-hydroxychromene-2-carboxylate isomerase [Cupriavidus sp. AU9028]
MNRTIDYYFTPQSPYVYLGHARLAEIARRHGAQIRMKPADLGKVFAVSGGLPLAQRPAQRQAYRLVELARWSEFLGLPLNTQPAFFPVSGDAASRLIIATQLAHGTARAMELTALIGRALWAQERNIADAATLAELAGQLELDGATLLKAAEAQAVQEEYERHTQDAISAGVFGAPWYVYNGQPFWGQDRLDFLDRALAAG